MKTTLSILLSLVSIAAYADGETQCMQNYVASAAKCDTQIVAQIALKHGTPSEKNCKTVQWNGQNEAGGTQSVDEHVLLLGKNGIVIINNKQDINTCRLHYMTMTDTPLEAKNLGGRVIIRSESGRIYAITRMGSLKEVFNDMNQRYYGVKDIKIDQQKNLVEVTHKSFEQLTAAELYNRLNTATKSEIIGM